MINKFTNWWFRISWRLKEWKYKRKYGMTMGEAMKWYGKRIIITEKKEKNNE